MLRRQLDVFADVLRGKKGTGRTVRVAVITKGENVQAAEAAAAAEAAEAETTEAPAES